MWRWPTHLETLITPDLHTNHKVPSLFANIVQSLQLSKVLKSWLSQSLCLTRSDLTSKCVKEMRFTTTFSKTRLNRWSCHPITRLASLTYCHSRWTMFHHLIWLPSMVTRLETAWTPPTTRIPTSSKVTTKMNTASFSLLTMLRLSKKTGPKESLTLSQILSFGVVLLPISQWMTSSSTLKKQILKCG